MSWFSEAGHAHLLTHARTHTHTHPPVGQLVRPAGQGAQQEEHLPRLHRRGEWGKGGGYCLVSPVSSRPLSSRPPSSRPPSSRPLLSLASRLFVTSPVCTPSFLTAPFLTSPFLTSAFRSFSFLTSPVRASPVSARPPLPPACGAGQFPRGAARHVQGPHRHTGGDVPLAPPHVP